MKALVLAIDFVKDVDGTFKALELNTGVGFHPLSQSAYLQSSILTDYISDNSITSFEYIGPGKFGDGRVPLVTHDVEAGSNQTHYTDYGKSAYETIKEDVSGSIQYNDNHVQVGSTVVPYVEDSDSTLIFRNSYDSSALVDSTYAASSINFLKFVNQYCTGSNLVSIPKTFIAPEGSPGQTYGEMVDQSPILDQIDDNNLRDNGVHPNYIVKLSESTVNSTYNTYPKLHKISSPEEMQALKNSLTGDLILQEYILNTEDLVEGKAKTYRMIGAIVGDNLEVLDFYTPYYVTNPVPLENIPDYSNTTLQKWERPAYVQKTNSTLGDKPGKFLYNTPLIKEGVDTNFNNLVEGDIIRAVTIDDLHDDESTFTYLDWTGSFDGTYPGNITSASIEDIAKSDEEIYNTVYVFKFNEEELVVGREAEILVVEDNVVRFKRAFDIEVGSTLLGFTHNNGSFVTDNKIVTEIKQKIIINISGTLDIEPADVVAVKSINGNTNFAIHNFGDCLCYKCVGGTFSNYDPCIQDPGLCKGVCSTSFPSCSGGTVQRDTRGDAGCGGNNK